MFDVAYIHVCVYTVCTYVHIAALLWLQHYKCEGGGVDGSVEGRLDDRHYLIVDEPLQTGPIYLQNLLTHPQPITRQGS